MAEPAFVERSRYYLSYEYPTKIRLALEALSLAVEAALPAIVALIVSGRTARLAGWPLPVVPVRIAGLARLVEASLLTTI